jgi:predicted transcriptional regulator
MPPLPNPRPKQLSLGPLETEILTILWATQPVTAKAIHETILSDPNRELAYPSVMTVLHRLAKKGWVTSQKVNRVFHWQAVVTREEAKVLQAHEQLRQFLAVSNPDVVAAFADSLDHASLDQIEAIASRIKAIRQARQEEE